MPTRASKRKASTSAAKAAAAKPAAKRSGKGSAATAAAAGPARKAASGSKATAAAAPSGPPLYAVRCQRLSSVVHWDEETFVDCDDPEWKEEEVQGCATAGDSVWFHDAAFRAWQHPEVKGAANRIVSMDGQGQLVVFESLEAANERAAAVFQDMLTHLPEWLRHAPAPATGSGRKRGGKAAAAFDELGEDEEADEEDEDEEGSEEEEGQASDSSSGAAGARGKRPRTGKASEQDAAEVDAQNVEPYRQALPGGRVQYKRQLHYFCDPWQCEELLQNRVESWVTVEVVPVHRGG